MERILKTVLAVMLLVTVGMAIGAFATGGSNAAINGSLMWGYLLVAVGIVAALGCSIYSMVMSPSGIKTTLVSLAVVVVVIGLSYVVASNNPKEILNIADGMSFDAGDTLITDVSIMVTYVVMGGAILVSLFSELSGIYSTYFKSNKPKAAELEE